MIVFVFGGGGGGRGGWDAESFFDKRGFHFS